MIINSFILETAEGLPIVEMTDAPNISSLDACSDATYTNRYIDKAGASPDNGDIIYVDVDGITPFDGGDKWYETTENNTSFIVSNVGVLSNKTVCP